MQSVPRGGIVTRPAPPLHRAFGFFRPPHRHHRHDSVLFFVGPSFLAPQPFGYPFYSYYPNSLYYPYSSLYGFGAPFGYATSPSLIASDRYYCWIHGIGFSDEARFAEHLHDVHGVPLDEVLSASEQVGGRYVFYGY